MIFVFPPNTKLAFQLSFGTDANKPTIKHTRESSPSPTYLIAIKIEVQRLSRYQGSTNSDSPNSWIYHSVQFFGFEWSPFLSLCLRNRFIEKIPMFCWMHFIDLIYSGHSLHYSIIYWTFSMRVKITYSHHIQNILIIKSWYVSCFDCRNH